MNNRYASLSEAAEVAVKHCQAWKFAYSDEQYDQENLLITAELHDEASLADEDSFYVIAPSGAIGFSEDGESVEWLFVRLDDPYEDLPLTLAAAVGPNFCSKCGAKAGPGAKFCTACGAPLG